jgi:hypothetical protein
MHLRIYLDGKGSFSISVDAENWCGQFSAHYLVSTYLLTALKPPKKFYKDMDKLRRRFLWAGNQKLHAGKCKVSWARVCRPLSC